LSKTCPVKLHRRLTQRRLFIEEGGRPFIKSRRRLFYLTHITHICREKAVCRERPFIEEEAVHRERRPIIEGGRRPSVEGGHSSREEGDSSSKVGGGCSTEHT